MILLSWRKLVSLIEFWKLWALIPSWQQKQVDIHRKRSSSKTWRQKGTSWIFQLQQCGWNITVLGWSQPTWYCLAVIFCERYMFDSKLSHKKVLKCIWGTKSCKCSFEENSILPAVKRCTVKCVCYQTRMASGYCLDNKMLARAEMDVCICLSLCLWWPVDCPSSFTLLLMIEDMLTQGMSW